MTIFSMNVYVEYEEFISNRMEIGNFEIVSDGDYRGIVFLDNTNNLLIDYDSNVYKNRAFRIRIDEIVSKEGRLPVITFSVEYSFIEKHSLDSNGRHFIYNPHTPTSNLTLSVSVNGVDIEDDYQMKFTDNETKNFTVDLNDKNISFSNELNVIVNAETSEGYNQVFSFIIDMNNLVVIDEYIDYTDDENSYQSNQSIQLGEVKQWNFVRKEEETAMDYFFPIYDTNNSFFPIYTNENIISLTSENLDYLIKVEDSTKYDIYDDVVKSEITSEEETIYVDWEWIQDSDGNWILVTEDYYKYDEEVGYVTKSSSPLPDYEKELMVSDKYMNKKLAVSFDIDSNQGEKRISLPMIFYDSTALSNFVEIDEFSEMEEVYVCNYQEEVSCVLTIN